MTNRLEKLRETIQKTLLENNNIDDVCDGLVHLNGVGQYCCLLAAKRNLDTEIATACGLLHDIYTYKYEYSKQHAQLGALEAEQILSSTAQFTPDEMELIVNAIAQHSDKKSIDNTNPYAELLKDADTLQNSLYNPRLSIKHKSRLKEVLKELGIKIKIKRLRGIVATQENEESN